MFQKLRCKKLFLLFSVVSTSYLFTGSEIGEKEPSPEKPIINKIIVENNKHVKTEVILKRLPYKVGEEFDESKSSLAINNLYALGYFRQVQIETEELDKDKVDVYVDVEEKKLLGNMEFKGNKQIKTKKIKDDLKLERLTTVDEENLQRIANAIKKMYAEESYHKTEVTTQIVTDKDTPDKATAVFTINEGPKSNVVRIYFKGNKHLPSRKLKNIIFTRENWILGFLDNAGQYDEDQLDMDKHRIEYLYKDNGYLMATVADVEVDFSSNEKKISITFHVKEGDLFTVSHVGAVDDELFTEKEILKYVTVEEDKPYSQSNLVDSINNIKNMYGEKGYIYADVYPQVKPDEENNTVNITFHVEKGKKLYVNRINITGNHVTRDKVIRRQIEMTEGEMITSRKLSESKSNVEYLSFFERDGVNWKVHRLTDDKADLEMNVKEAKTGSLQAGLTYGTDQQTPRPSLRGNIALEKKNLFGMGWDGGLQIQASRHRLQKFEGHFFDPSIFDSDVSGGISGYVRWEEYIEWKNVNKTPREQIAGGNFRLGFMLPKIDPRLRLMLEFGVEDISNNDPRSYSPLFEPIVKRTFQEGTLSWIGLDLIKDTRNHQIYPNKGYKLALNTKTAPPFTNMQYSFLKAELEASWYTPLIGEDDLVLMLHGKTGTVHTIGGTNKSTHKSKQIPYKELFHMGGQNTVRGFVWGSLGPAWHLPGSFDGSPLGGRYAIQFNAELIFPLIPDYSMKGHVFYDAGAGWDTPKDDIRNRSNLMRDHFHLRHSVGFGLNLLKPMPAKIDWGYKLDRKKKEGESPYEFHLSMNYAW